MFDDISQYLIDRLDSILAGYVQRIFENIVAAYQETFIVLISLMIIIWALGKIFSLGEGTLQEFAWKVVVLPALVLAIATSWPNYTIFVYDIFTKEPDNLVRIMMGGIPILEYLDNLIDLGIDASWIFISNAGLGVGVVWLIVGLLFLGTLVIMSLLAIGIIMAAKILTAILLSLGPLFIFAAVFETGRAIFLSWIRSLLTMAFAIVLINAILRLVLDIIYRPVFEVSTGLVEPDLKTAAALLMYLGVSFFLFFYMMILASALFGGAPMRFAPLTSFSLGIGGFGRSSSSAGGGGRITQARRE